MNSVRLNLVEVPFGRQYMRPRLFVVLRCWSICLSLSLSFLIFDSLPRFYPLEVLKIALIWRLCWIQLVLEVFCLPSGCCSPCIAGMKKACSSRRSSAYWTWCRNNLCGDRWIVKPKNGKSLPLLKYCEAVVFHNLLKSNKQFLLSLPGKPQGSCPRRS